MGTGKARLLVDPLDVVAGAGIDLDHFALLDEQQLDPQRLFETLDKEIHNSITGQLMPEVLLPPLASGELFCCELPDLQAMTQGGFMLAVQLLAQQSLNYSFWWTSGSQLRPAQFRIFDDMPPAQAYTSFLERATRC